MSGSRLLFILFLFPVLGGGYLCAQVERIPPPQFGHASGQTRYVSRFTTIASFDFEKPLAGITDQPGVELVPANEGMNGAQSLRITGEGLLLSTSHVPLQPENIYLVNYTYRIPSGCSHAQATTAIFQSAGEMAIPMGRGPASLPGDYGTASATLRFSAAQPLSITIPRGACDLTIDDLIIQRHDVDAFDGAARLINAGFPRISKYMVTTPTEVAIRTGVPLPEIESRLSAYHMVHGLDADHTIVAGAYVQRIRNLNPDILLLGYHNSFMADMTPLQNINGSSILPLLYNRGIADEWYMLDPLGNRYNSPDFPYLVQLNHTDGCIAPHQPSLIGYTTDYLTRTILPSGLWDGIHFDQPETTPNPLLLPKSAGSEQPPPPIDLDCDGTAEPLNVLYDKWLAGFKKYFSQMGDAFGHQYLMFGNAGYINQQKDVLTYLNGWLAEVISPYQILENGNWNTNDASGWYRLINNYLSADKLVRAPQMVSMQFTGQMLGKALNRLTPNGIPDRESQLEARDYQRMRLGLTTTLMGNGFFGYDLVDNTTSPVWFDEYAVDENGDPSTKLKHRGYLGQPLGEAEELGYLANPVMQIDFESPPPAAFQPGSGFTITAKPEEVIHGQRSLLVYRGAGNESGLMFMTDSSQLRLSPGKTYQIVADYKVIKYRGERFQGLLALGVTTPEEGLPAGRVASLYQPDVMGAGQAGTLRASAKMTRNGGFGFGYILDNAVIALDNIRIIEGSGGVWRRDFENGIVLVNPTPEPITLPFNRIAGSLQRRNIRRIRGTQASVWNNGSAQTGSITIPPADGIILLAEKKSKPALMQVQNFRIQENPASRTGLFASWDRHPDYRAGYKIVYGEDFANLKNEIISGQDSNRIEVPAPPSGSTFFYRIQSFDFQENTGPFSESFLYSSSESPQNRPDFRLSSETPIIAPGSWMTLIGSSLASEIEVAQSSQIPLKLGGVQVFVNGIEAPVGYVSPFRVDAIVPWEIAGTQCRIRIVRNGIASEDRFVTCAPTSPKFIYSIFQDQIEIYRKNNGTAVRVENPAQAGEELFVRMEGLGRIEPPALNGQPSTADFSGVTAPVSLRIGGQAVSVSNAQLVPGSPATYDVFFRIPEGMTGPQSILLIAGNASSRTATIYLQ